MEKTKLYIVGNGFDLRHEICSSYSDFKVFLKKEDKELFELVMEYLPVFEHIDCPNNDWCNLEAALGEIDINWIVENNSVFLPSYADEDWKDSGHHDFQYEIGRIVDSLSAILRGQFAKWVRKIEIPSALSAPNRLSTLDPNGLYLTFNYTSTLLTVYSVPTANTLHIHGQASMPDTDLVLGHSWKPRERKSLNDYPGVENQDTRMTEAYYILDEYFSKTFKHSAKIIQENSDFFARLWNIEEIFVFGHSLGEVDRNYFESIVSKINIDNVRWTIACLEPIDIPKKQALIGAFRVPVHLINTVLWNSL